MCWRYTGMPAVLMNTPAWGLLVVEKCVGGESVVFSFGALQQHMCIHSSGDVDDMLLGLNTWEVVVQIEVAWMRWQGRRPWPAWMRWQGHGLGVCMDALAGAQTGVCMHAVKGHWTGSACLRRQKL